MKCVFVYPVSAKTNQDGKALIIKWPCFFFFCEIVSVLFILEPKPKRKIWILLRNFLVWKMISSEIYRLLLCSQTDKLSFDPSFKLLEGVQKLHLSS